MIDGMGDPTEPRYERFVTRRTARAAVRGPADPAVVREFWIVLHGYGQLAAPFLDGFRAVDDGTRLLVAPEALSRFYDTRTALEKHAEATVGASWMTREDRLEEIADQQHFLQQVHDHFRARIGPAAPLTVLGFSQGTAAASRWVATGAAPAAHLVAWGGAIAPELPLGAGSVLGRTRCSIVSGDRDRFVPEERLTAECARLDAAGFTYTLVRYAGGHRLDDGALRQVAGIAPAAP